MVQITAGPHQPPAGRADDPALNIAHRIRSLDEVGEIARGAWELLEATVAPS